MDMFSDFYTKRLVSALMLSRKNVIYIHLGSIVCAAKFKEKLLVFVLFGCKPQPPAVAGRPAVIVAVQTIA